MTRHVSAVCALLVFLAASPLHAQAWNKKDWRHWSANDCHKILSSSPWAQSWSSSATEMLSGSQQTPTEMGGQRSPEIYVRYLAVFFSALPVREAEVRLGQIEAHYDQMSAAQKAAFDQNAARFLAVPFPTDMVVRVTYETNVQAQMHTLIDFWQKQTTASMRPYASFEYEKQTIPTSRYVRAPGVEPAFYLYFPREVNGQAWLASAAKSINLQIRITGMQFAASMGPPGGVTASFANSMNFEFRPKKMQMKGKLYY